jgi:hypothetical protein
MGKNIPNGLKIYQNGHKYTKMGIKYTYWPQNRPNVQKLQHLPLQDPPKFTQIVIFGLKIYHLATPHCVERVAGARLF